MQATLGARSIRLQAGSGVLSQPDIAKSFCPGSCQRGSFSGANVTLCTVYIDIRLRSDSSLVRGENTSVAEQAFPQWSTRVLGGGGWGPQWLSGQEKPGGRNSEQR